VLIMGRMPEPLFEATAAIARYLMRVEAYWLMLTTAYPKRLFGDGTGQATPGTNATRPFLMTTAGRVILIVIIVIGVASGIGSGFGSGSGNSDSTTAQPLPLTCGFNPAGGSAFKLAVTGRIGDGAPVPAVTPATGRAQRP
jgi:hypothetical protein